eukprot:jgi/Mesvir1/28092/Mv04680-RA.1
MQNPGIGWTWVGQPTIARRNDRCTTDDYRCSHARAGPMRDRPDEHTARVKTHGIGWAKLPRATIRKWALSIGRESSSQTSSWPASEPITSMLRVATAESMCKRNEMEDAGLVIPNAISGYSLIAVFDGHTGFETATYLKEHMLDACVAEMGDGSCLDDDEAAEAALTRVFQKLDDEILAWLPSQNNIESGSTALVVFVRQDRIVIANTGDCKAVLLSQGDKVQELNEAHRAYGNDRMAKAEIRRVDEAGGWIQFGRVGGLLAVTRAFGDAELKGERRRELIEEGVQKKSLSARAAARLKLDEEWIISTPDVKAVNLTSDDKLLCIATDGLWDVFSGKQAMLTLKSQYSNSSSDIQKATVGLLQEAEKHKKAYDNICIVTVAF